MNVTVQGAIEAGAGTRNSGASGVDSVALKVKQC